MGAFKLIAGRDQGRHKKVGCCIKVFHIPIPVGLALDRHDRAIQSLGHAVAIPMSAKGQDGFKVSNGCIRN